jgi:hypothetical protein
MKKSKGQSYQILGINPLANELTACNTVFFHELRVTLAVQKRSDFYFVEKKPSLGRILGRMNPVKAIFL